jgi:hypothetical protein
MDAVNSWFGSDNIIYEKQLDDEHTPKFSRHAIGEDTKHLIVVSCWYWRGVRDDAYLNLPFEE